MDPHPYPLCNKMRPREFEKAGQTFTAQKKEVGGNRVTLSNSSQWVESSKHLTIDPNRKRYCFYTPHDQLHPFLTEAKFEHNSPQVVPFNPIVGFCHVEFYCASTNLPFL